METYTKINTLFKRYQNVGNCPNPKWRVMQNKIILNAFADTTFEYLLNNVFESYSKIDGTNSKICYYPSTQEIFVGGKTDKANSQHGQFEYLQQIADRILPKMKEMFPVETARFSPKCDNHGKVIVKEDNTVEMEEIPIYIYGEYYGCGIQKCGGAYSKENKFAVFDIRQQGWWIPSDMRHAICQELELEEVPFYGYITLADAINEVRKGFTTKVEGAVDSSLMEEGLVLRPTEPLKDSRGNRIIVKVKYCDFKEYDEARSKFTNEEFEEFEKWYYSNIENK